MEIRGFDERMLVGLDEAQMHVLAEATWTAFLVWARAQPNASHVLTGLELVSVAGQALEQGKVLEDRQVRAALEAAEWLGALAQSQNFGVTAWFLDGEARRFRAMLG